MEPEPILPSPTELQPVGPSTESPNGTGSEVSPPAAPEVSLGPRIGAQSVATTNTPQQIMQPVVPVANPHQQINQDDQGGPAIADDVDVIEKEWVDKAKKIVSSTKDDPYSQEKQVSKLQADYLMKRYGKQIKTVD